MSAELLVLETRLAKLKKDYEDKIIQLEAHIEALTTRDASIEPIPELNPPKEFDRPGDDAAVDAFIFDMKGRINYHAPTMSEENKIFFVSTYLAPGIPKDWHSALKFITPLSDHLANLDAYFTHFKQVFGNPNAAEEAMVELQQLKQTTTVVNFAISLRHLGALAQVSSSYQLLLFKRGLKRYISSALVIARVPRNLEAAIEAAIGIERDFLVCSKPVVQSSQSNWNWNSEFPQNSESPTYAESLTPSTSHTPPKRRVKNGRGPMHMQTNAIRIHLINGKLPPNERQRRIQLNLCTYCGDSQHQKDTCPRKKPRGFRFNDA